MRTRSLESLALLGFTVGAVGCGVHQVPLTLALEEGSAITIAVPGFGPGGTELVLGTTDLEGAIETTIAVEIDPASLFRDKLPVVGSMEDMDVLFGGTEIDILGNPTGTLCVVPNPSGTLGGSVVADPFDDQGTWRWTERSVKKPRPWARDVRFRARAIDIDVDMVLDTAIELTDPFAGGAIPDGVPFTLSISDAVELSLRELIAVSRGKADGVVSINQPLDVTYVAEVLPNFPLPLHVTGELIFTSANAFPTGLLLDTCIEFLGR